ncbi:MAG TPA: hypothetical protein DIW52_07980, partial [Pseudomonas sp.]|nr:hypothetical protein [Pseudomonas sp.]
MPGRVSERLLAVGVQHKHPYATGHAAQTLCIDMQAGAVGKPRIKHRGAHESTPQQGAPIAGLGLEGVFVQKPVVAGDQGIVKYHVYLLASEPPELVKVAESVEEGAPPRIAAAARVSRLGVPERLARH